MKNHDYAQSVKDVPLPDICGECGDEKPTKKIVAYCRKCGVPICSACLWKLQDGICSDCATEQA